MISKDADKTICAIYKEFLTRRNNGLSKLNSANFTFNKIKQLFPNETDDNLYNYLSELSRNKFIKDYDLCGNFELSDNGIVYMEQRFGNKLDKLIDYISKFIP